MEPTAPSLYPRLDFEVPSVQVDSEKLESKQMDSKLQIKPIDEDVVCKNGQPESNNEESINLQNNQDNDTTLHCKHKFKKMFSIFVSLALVMLLIGFLTGSFFQQKGFIQVWNGNEKSELIRKSWNLDTRENVKRRDFIRQMMRNAWNAHETHAWGCDWLKPVTRECVHGNAGASMTASMSTLWVMELKPEFERAREWIQREMDFENLQNLVNVFDAVTGQIGGLLSCFALTGDRMFVDKASVIARKLGLVYDECKFWIVPGNTPIGYPITDVPFPFSEIIPYRNKYGGESEFKLSQIAQQLEYVYLANMAIMTQDDKIAERLEPIWRLIEHSRPVAGQDLGLYRSRYEVSMRSGIWYQGDISTLWEDGSEFYANLLKAYIQSNGAQHQLIDWYLAALDAFEKRGVFVRAPNSSSSSLYYTKELLLYRFRLDSEDGAPYIKMYQEFLEEQKPHHSKMHITSCYIGAMLGLSASLNLRHATQINTTDQQRWMDLAENMTDGCQLMSDSTKTGLMAREWDFADEKQNQYHYELSPQLAQSYFILWRLTHNQKYRDNAWKMVQAIEKNCRVEGSGYSSIHNVDQVPTVKINIQPPHFLSATLKYLYLTFADDSVLPLDQWVFNSAGHPLPICGTSDAYPSCGFSFIKFFKKTFNYLVKFVS